MPRKLGAFGFALGFHNGFWQKQGLIKSKIRTKKKVRLREKKYICTNERALTKVEMSIENEINRPFFTGRLVSFLFSFRFSISKKVNNVSCLPPLCRYYS